jgi:hypothetical protein
MQEEALPLVEPGPSRRHSNVTSGSFAENVNEADVSLNEPKGPLFTVTVGGCVSTCPLQCLERVDDLHGASVGRPVWSSMRSSARTKVGLEAVRRPTTRSNGKLVRKARPCCGGLPLERKIPEAFTSPAKSQESRAEPPHADRASESRNGSRNRRTFPR